MPTVKIIKGKEKEMRRKNALKNSNLRNSITEFMAGGLFAFAVFSVMSFLLIALNAGSVMSFFGELAEASAKISSPGVADKTYKQPEDENKTDFSSDADSDFSKLSDRLIKLSKNSGWSIEEAPEETEEPEDASELLQNDLPYPDSLGTKGGKIVRKTYSYSPTTTCVCLPNGGMIKNSTDIDTEYLLEQAQRDLDFEIELCPDPEVLIMHTHTTECYEPYPRDRYDKDFTSRTTDLDKSIVAVGEEIAKQLKAGGIGVIHDTTVHDYPRYTGAYDRSSKTVEQLLEEYPSVKIVIDVHRDAIESEGVRYAPVCEVDGEAAAQVMIIVGCMNVPKYRYNLRFASRLQSKMELDYPGFTRPILFAERNYNQELTHASILIEVGSNSNSLDEALYSGRLVGMSLSELLTDLADR